MATNIIFEHVRIRDDSKDPTDDDGWLFPLDQDAFDLRIGQKIRIRCHCVKLSGTSETTGMQLQRRHEEGANTWNNVSRVQSGLNIVDSNHYVNQDESTVLLLDSTNLITPNTGLIDADIGAATRMASVTWNIFTGVEVEFCIQLQEADVSVGDTIHLRLRTTGNDTLSDNLIDPVITVIERLPAGAIRGAGSLESVVQGAGYLGPSVRGAGAFRPQGD